MTQPCGVLWPKILGATFLLIPLLAIAQGGPNVVTFITFDVPGAGASAAPCLLQGTFPYLINDEGQIGGNFQDANNVLHGFLRARDGATTAFDAPGAGTGACQGTQGFTISPEGEVAGITIDAGYLRHGMLRERDGTITVFDGPGAGSFEGTFALGVNREGTVVGWYLDPSNVSHSFLRARDGSITTFEAAGAGTGAFQGTSPCVADCINAAGAVTGVYGDSNNVPHAFIRAADGTITTFDAPGAGTGAFQGTGGAGINHKGVIVGAYTDANNANHGFVRARDGTIITFDAPGAGTGAFPQGTLASGVAGINAEGEITGAYVDANNVSHGFVRAPDGAISTFDAPGAGTGAFQGTTPMGINSRGVITGTYVDANNVGHGFLRIPGRPEKEGD